MVQEEQIGFFGDIKSFILKFLIGLAPIATLVPLILNKTHTIFSISYDWSYIVFTIVYFSLPILAVSLLIWYKLYFRNRSAGAEGEDRGRAVKEFTLSSNGYWFILGLILAMTLVSGISIHYIFNTGLLVAFLIGCGIWTAGVLILLALACVDYYRIHRIVPRSERLHTGLIQYLLLVLLLLSAVFIFAFHFQFKIPNVSEGDGQDIHKYIDALRMDQDSVKEYPDKVKGLIDSMRLIFFQAGICKDSKCDTAKGPSVLNRFRPKVDDALCELMKVLDSVYKVVPDSNWNGKDGMIDSIWFYHRCKRLFEARVTRLLNNLDTAMGIGMLTPCLPGLEALRGYCEGRLGMFNRLTGSYKDKMEETTKEHWAVLLKRVQFYCFLIFGSGILLLLTLWFYFYIHSVYRQESGIEDKGPDGEAILKPLRGCTILLMLLCIPFIRSFDKKSLNLNSPFIHFSLQSFVKGGDETPPVNIYEGPTDLYIDSSKSFGAGALQGDTLARILRDVDSTKEQERKDHQETKKILIP